MTTKCGKCDRPLTSSTDAYLMDSTWAAQYRITSDPVICSTCYVDADWGVCNPSAHPHPQGIDAACDAQAHAIARGTPAGLRNLLRQ